MGEWLERASLTIRLKPVSTFSQNFWQPSCHIQDTVFWEGSHQSQRKKLGLGQDGDGRLGVTKSCWAPCSSQPWSLVTVLCLVAQLCPTLCDHMDCSPPGSSVHGDSPGKNTGVGCHALLQGNLSNPGIQPRSPALQADSLPTEPPGKPEVILITVYFKLIITYILMYSKVLYFYSLPTICFDVTIYIFLSYVSLYYFSYSFFFLLLSFSFLTNFISD